MELDHWSMAIGTSNQIQFPAAQVSRPNSNQPVLYRRRFQGATYQQLPFDNLPF